MAPKTLSSVAFDETARSRLTCFVRSSRCVTHGWGLGWQVECLPRRVSWRDSLDLLYVCRPHRRAPRSEA